MTETRFIKIIAGIVTCAVFAFFYVHQEIEIVKTSFRINKSRQKLSFLLDQHRALVYNLSQLESPKRIEDKLYVNRITLYAPRVENMRHYFDKLNLVKAPQTIQSEMKEPFLARFLDRFATKAEAKSVK